MVFPLPAESVPQLQNDRLLSLRFGEGCLIEEYHFLYGLVLLLQPKSILEIGTSTGVGTIVLASAACAFGRQAKVTTIDIQLDPRRKFNFSRFPELAGMVETVLEPSGTALARFAQDGRRFDLVFIDGGHAYEQVRDDWLASQPLTDFWLLHDTVQEPGCKRLVQEIQKEGRYSVVTFTYPTGHQAVSDCIANGVCYDGVYEQAKLPWHEGNFGPGITIVQRV